MDITEKMIRELQRRVDVSYEEAERFLRRAGGNIEIAESYALRKENSFWSRLFTEIENIIDASLAYRLKIYKEDDVFTNIPVMILVVMLILIGVDKSLLVGVVFVVWALLADCNLKLDKVERKSAFRFNRTVVKSVSDVTPKRVAKVTSEDGEETMTVEASGIVRKRPKKNEEKRAYRKVKKAEKRRKRRVQVDIEIQGQEVEVEPFEEETIEPIVEMEENTSGEYLPDDEDDDDYYEVTIEK